MSHSAEHYPDPLVVMTLGCGLETIGGSSAAGAISYAPSLASEARASEAALFHDAHPDIDPLYLFSGGFARIIGGNRMPIPPHLISEADLQEQAFLHRIGSTLLPGANPGSNLTTLPQAPRTAVEGDSDNHFTKMLHSIRSRYLQVGDFTPDRPLVFSAGELLSQHIGLAAAQALALPPASLYRLRDSGHEGGVKVGFRSVMLLAMTRLALADVGEVGAAEPGNLQHTIAASQAFQSLCNQPVRILLRTLQRAGLGESNDVPLLPYWQ